MRSIFLFVSLFLRIGANEIDANILPLDAGTIQVSSSIDKYYTVKAGKPIQGTVMVTHDRNQEIDASSFYIGNKQLNVQLLQTTPMSEGGSLVVSIYSFTIEGLKEGEHELSPIRARVAGKEYQAPPIYIQISE